MEILFKQTPEKIAYSKPKINICFLSPEDIITTSGAGGYYDPLHNGNNYNDYENSSDYITGSESNVIGGVGSGGIGFLP